MLAIEQGYELIRQSVIQYGEWDGRRRITSHSSPATVGHGTLLKNWNLLPFCEGGKTCLKGFVREFDKPLENGEGYLFSKEVTSANLLPLISETCTVTEAEVLIGEHVNYGCGKTKKTKFIRTLKR